MYGALLTPLSLSRRSAPTHIYGSLGLAREFMATLPEEEIGKFGDPPFIPKPPGEGEDPGPKTFAAPAAIVPKPPAQQRIFAKTQFDEFCGDVPSAPETVRRCLAIVRSICLLGQLSDKFVYPTNTKDVPTFYEKVLRPTCLIDIGRKLLAAADSEEGVDEAKLVSEFVDDMHLLYNNTYCFNVVGSVTINNMEKVATVFERLLYDWLLQPELPPLEELDDDKCYAGGRHESDDEFPMLICDKVRSGGEWQGAKRRDLDARSAASTAAISNGIIIFFFGSRYSRRSARSSTT